MSIRRNGFALLLTLALLFAPAALAADQAATGGFWQALTSWLISSLGLGDVAEGGYGILPGGSDAVHPGQEDEGGCGILPGG
jgi:hypothetical protein